jgi:hypothetical protein
MSNACCSFESSKAIDACSSGFGRLPPCLLCFGCSALIALRSAISAGLRLANVSISRRTISSNTRIALDAVAAARLRAARRPNGAAPQPHRNGDTAWRSALLCALCRRSRVDEAPPRLDGNFPPVAHTHGLDLAGPNALHDVPIAHPPAIWPTCLGVKRRCSTPWPPDGAFSRSISATWSAMVRANVGRSTVAMTIGSLIARRYQSELHRD